MTSSQRKEILILTICLLLGFALRFYTFDQKSLWLDEIHTYNDSKDDIKGQLNFYRENPSYLHPPLFFVLTHQLYPFTRPERDIRIIPLIFGTLSIPMIYVLARSFSQTVALPCALSLSFMAYHISLSQDGRCYSLLMFFGTVGLYFFMKHLQTSKKRYLFLVAIFFSTLFYTSYSSIPFIILSQILWFFRPTEQIRRPSLLPFLILNGLILLLCLPWILFVAIHYKGEAIMDPFHIENLGSFWYILYGILNDWVPYAPLMLVSVLLLILLPIFSKSRKNALILLFVFVLPIVGLYSSCKLLHVTHFVTSRYFINFLPLFFISLFLCLDSMEMKFERLRRFLRLRLLFVILFIASNLIILPLYYHSEKQDFRGLVAYLKGNLGDGDKIFVADMAYYPGILHYFGARPEVRHYRVPSLKDSDETITYQKFFMYRERNFPIYHSNSCCTQYISDGGRLWIVVDKPVAKKLKESSPSVLKGYFDGSFLNLNRFPIDASMYLFLFNPSSPIGRGIDIPIK